MIRWKGKKNLLPPYKLCAALQRITTKINLKNKTERIYVWHNYFQVGNPSVDVRAEIRTQTRSMQLGFDTNFLGIAVEIDNRKNKQRISKFKKWKILLEKTTGRGKIHYTKEHKGGAFWWLQKISTTLSRDNREIYIRGPYMKSPSSNKKLKRNFHKPRFSCPNRIWVTK